MTAPSTIAPRQRRGMCLYLKRDGAVCNKGCLNGYCHQHKGRSELKPCILCGRGTASATGYCSCTTLQHNIANQIGRHTQKMEPDSCPNVAEERAPDHEELLAANEAKHADIVDDLLSDSDATVESPPQDLVLEAQRLELVARLAARTVPGNWHVDAAACGLSSGHLEYRIRMKHSQLAAPLKFKKSLSRAAHAHGSFRRIEADLFDLITDQVASRFQLPQRIAGFTALH